MKNLVRGGALLTLLSLFVVIIFAQTRTETPLATTADDSPVKIEKNLPDNTSNSNKTDDDKKLVKTTASVKAAGAAAGASRGSFSASAYCFSGRTAMGHGVRRGIVAAAFPVLVVALMQRPLKLKAEFSTSGSHRR